MTKITFNLVFLCFLWGISNSCPRTRSNSFIDKTSGNVLNCCHKEFTNTAEKCIFWKMQRISSFYRKKSPKRNFCPQCVKKNGLPMYFFEIGSRSTIFGNFMKDPHDPITCLYIWFHFKCHNTSSIHFSFFWHF